MLSLTRAYLSNLWVNTTKALDKKPLQPKRACKGLNSPLNLKST